MAHAAVFRDYGHACCKAQVALFARLDDRLLRRVDGKQLLRRRLFESITWNIILVPDHTGKLQYPHIAPPVFA